MFKLTVIFENIVLVAAVSEQSHTISLWVKNRLPESVWPAGPADIHPLPANSHYSRNRFIAGAEPGKRKAARNERQRKFRILEVFCNRQGMIRPGQQSFADAGIMVISRLTFGKNSADILLYPRKISIDQRFYRQQAMFRSFIRRHVFQPSSLPVTPSGNAADSFLFHFKKQQKRRGGRNASPLFLYFSRVVYASGTGCRVSPLAPLPALS